MRFLLVALSLLLALVQPPSQTCQEITVVITRQQHDLLRDYVSDCLRKNFFFEGKGLIKLIIYHDRKNRLCWNVQAFVDDRYQSAPPLYYSWFEHQIILVYYGTEQGNIIPVTKDMNTPVLNACLAEYVGGRVYKYVNNPSYIIETIGGHKVKTPVSLSSVGNGHNELVFQFNEDGTVTKIIPM